MPDTMKDTKMSKAKCFQGSEDTVINIRNLKFLSLAEF